VIVNRSSEIDIAIPQFYSERIKVG